MFIQRDDYNHCFKDDLKRFNINEVRHYAKEGSDIAYPSVTSILSLSTDLSLLSGVLALVRKQRTRRLSVPPLVVPVFTLCLSTLCSTMTMSLWRSTRFL